MSERDSNATQVTEDHEICPTCKGSSTHQKMDRELLAEWLAALRGGKYTQAHGVLRATSGGYCCLGVLCDVVDSSQWVGAAGFARDHFLYGSERKGLGLPLSIQMESSLDPRVMEKAVEMNDTGSTFSEIADYLEQYA